MSLTSIITVNYNQSEATIDFLESIKRNLNLSELEVILVDNASVDDHGEDFKTCFPNLIYIRSEVNLGFAGGNNLGLKFAQGDYILMLNNDTEVIEGMVDVLIQEMEANPQIGIISPLILYYDQPETIQYAGFSPMNYMTCRNKTNGLLSKNTGQFSAVSTETAFCHGAAMMCRRADIEKIGVMPEVYFLYYEELDWCEMFKKAGKKIWFTGKTHIFHKESMSVGRESALKTYFITRNRILFIRRNTSVVNTILFSLYFTCIATPKQMIKYVRDSRTDLIPYLRKAIFWHLTNSKESRNFDLIVNK